MDLKRLNSAVDKKLKRLAEGDDYEDQDIFRDYKVGNAVLEIGLHNGVGGMKWNVYRGSQRVAGGPCTSESNGMAKAQAWIRANYK
jgi:hypothetical protein